MPACFHVLHLQDLCKHKELSDKAAAVCTNLKEGFTAKQVNLASTFVGDRSYISGSVLVTLETRWYDSRKLRSVLSKSLQAYEEVMDYINWLY